MKFLESLVRRQFCDREDGWIIIIGIDMMNIGVTHGEFYFRWLEKKSRCNLDGNHSKNDWICLACSTTMNGLYCGSSCKEFVNQRKSVVGQLDGNANSKQATKGHTGH